MAGVRPELFGQLEPESREDRSRSKEHKGAALQMVMHEQMQTPDWDALTALPIGERLANESLPGRAAAFTSAVAEVGVDAGWLGYHISDAQGALAMEATPFQDRRSEGRRYRSGPDAHVPYRDARHGDLEDRLDGEPDPRYRLW
jgi:hypothetical protein